MQFDIFEHSQDVMLRNDAAHALERRDASAARQACERLAAEYPHDEHLLPLRILCEHVEAVGEALFRDHEALREARARLETSVQPAAQRIFGEVPAASFLTSSWEAFARRARSLAFDPRFPHDHAAALWLCAGAWQAAAEAVSAIESWRRKPVPLFWMVQARLHLLGLQATWPLLAELGWLSPALLEDVARSSPDPLLPRLIGKFEASFEGDSADRGATSDLSWFAAWVLTERPTLREPLALAEPSQHSAPEQAMRLMVELLGLERQGRHADIVARRKLLRDLQPSLYAAYMKSR
ncbi:hypothetical protein APR50_39415 [Variovorax paradoxus]|uniref:hypothetical protein n=1 Tax=Variovorax paradoxus TaxID=34073 RepID=UPI0006E58532|nr:hypothetical protein APR52_42570 [Variovorax paradoxus]KPU92784.1 hypothetical protein APR50_39415 [Variovorax paradoxus]KPU93937.1 hypothetical protein APR49_38775 [Variovorax paradoxus]KPV14587.1 hypothetical protein APR51_38375 [Variovorax paradoxus]KPV21170.1 hypothetical protein APR48_38185 [Variovorax paradoxus]